MKIRKDFVTNSSSSSFIICKDNVSYEQLLQILLEIANKESSYYGDEEYTEEDITEDCVAHRYYITDATRENPHLEYEDDWLCTGEIIYDNHYIIDTHGCVSDDWDSIEEVLSKYNIPWEQGYCD